MPIPPRVQLVEVDPTILSSFDGRWRVGGPRGNLQRLRDVEAGSLTPDTAAALLALSAAVQAAGGDFRVTDGWRPVATQAAARARYDRWLAAGSPGPKDPKWDPTNMKADFVAKPGRSNHGAGRAVDIGTRWLAFPGVPADKQLDRLWELARPLGWTPVIKAPTEGVSENWHFDFSGPWAPVRARLGYEQAAIAATLDVGISNAFPKDGDSRRLQGGLHRAGYDVGDIDGIVGPRTLVGLVAAGYPKAVSALGLLNLQDAVTYVDTLPDSPVVLWHK